MNAREEVEQTLRRMSPWQMHLFLTSIQNDLPGEKFREHRSTFAWILLNPPRVIMWAAYLAGMKPWLWFGVKIQH